MQKDDLFYQCYDALYFSKNYDEEVNLIVSLAKKFYPGKIKNVLEIGAGTGNHTMCLALYDFSITAIDTDEKMILHALNKITKTKFPQVKLINTSVEKLKEKNFDFALAGFNVINYLPDFNSMLSFFKAISSRLKKNGLLIFDCWNGIAAVIDPPKSKVINGKMRDNLISCTVASETDFMKQKTILTYLMEITDEKKKKINSGNFSFEQTLWTPMEINHCLNDSGFKVLKCSPNLKPEIQAKETDWKIMFLCKKTH